jgi:hypothetical protein
LGVARWQRASTRRRRGWIQSQPQRRARQANLLPPRNTKNAQGMPSSAERRKKSGRARVLAGDFALTHAHEPCYFLMNTICLSGRVLALRSPVAWRARLPLLPVWVKPRLRLLRDQSCCGCCCCDGAGAQRRSQLGLVLIACPPWVRQPPVRGRRVAQRERLLSKARRGLAIG